MYVKYVAKIVTKCAEIFLRSARCYKMRRNFVTKCEPCYRMRSCDKMRLNRGPSIHKLWDAALDIHANLYHQVGSIETTYFFRIYFQFYSSP